jgi:hypothetical protein
MNLLRSVDGIQWAERACVAGHVTPCCQAESFIVIELNWIEFYCAFHRSIYMDIESVVQHNTDMVQNAFMQVPIQVQVQYNNYYTTFSPAACPAHNCSL